MTPERKAELRDLAKCRVCSGKGRFDPHCWRCDDSGDDHECPPERVCDACSSTGKDPRQTEMLDEIEQLEDENRMLSDAYNSACRMVADMHAAAVGEVRGPIRGVVEDIADLRTKIERLEGVVREAHRGWISVDAMGVTTGFPLGDKARCERYVEAGVRNGVRYRYGGSCHLGCPTPQDRLHWRATWDEAVADHVAHVEDQIRGET